MISTKTITRRRLDAILRRSLSNESGSALVEMGIGTGIFMLFFFGILQFCYGLYAYNYVGEAAREATRWAIVRGSKCNHNMGSAYCASGGVASSDITNYVQNLGFPGLNKSSISVSSSWYSASTTTPTSWSLCTGVCNDPGNEVQVSVSYPVPLPIPFWKNLTLNVASTSQMVISQ